MVSAATLLHEARDLSDALDVVPGLRVVRIGGHGAPVRVQIRGATSAQNLVTLGDIPLRSPTGRPLDLEAVPVVALRGLELWRSRAPSSVSSTPIGGVIRLRPVRPGRGAAVRAGIGAYGAALLEARGSWGSPRGNGGSLSLRALTSDGDFSYLHDAGTPLDKADDYRRTRGNNHVRRLSGLAQQSLRVGQHWRLGATWLGGWRHQGLAGLAAIEASRANLTAHHHDVVLRAANTHGGTSAEVWLRGGLERMAVDDVLGELGPVQQRSQLVRAAEVGTRWRQRRGTLRPRVALSARYGGVHTSDELTGRGSPESNQLAGTLSAGVDLRYKRWQVSPTVRAAVIDSQRFEDQGWTARWTDVDVPTRTLISGEIGALARPCAGCQLRASLTLGNRAPTLIELFGNDGTVRPSPRLRDERASTASVGATLRRGDAARHASLSLSGFWSSRRNLIQLVRAGPGQAIHTNVGRANVMGAEVSTRGAWGPHLVVEGGWAWLRGRDEGDNSTYTGNVLPMRPAARWHVAGLWRNVRITSALRGGVRVAARWQAGTFADRANLVIIPAREQVDTSLYLRSGAWRATVRLDNALDRPRFDKVGLPLPGRTWMVNLAWRAGVDS